MTIWDLWGETDDAILSHYLHHLPEHGLAGVSNPRPRDEAERIAQEIQAGFADCSQQLAIQGTAGTYKSPNHYTYRDAAVHWGDVTARYVRQLQQAEARYRTMRQGSAVLMLVIVGLLIWGAIGWGRL